MMDRIEVKFSADQVDAKTGEFSGYGAVFGNIDSHGDVISPGAFAETLADWAGKGRLPVMKLMHGTMLNPFSGSDLPIGVWKSMREDSRGLAVEGKLSGIDTDYGRRLHALVKDGALDGLSIGYKAKRFSRPGAGSQAKRILDSVHLGEISLVSDPSNGRSRISAIKAAEEIKTIREFEDFLRNVGGYSATQAKRIAASGFKSIDATRDAGDGQEVSASFDRLISTLTK
jgi:HK97 family phage prohead protease